MRVQLPIVFEEVASIENLLAAWGEFLNGKRARRDVQAFSLRLMDNLFLLHEELIRGTYRHGGYESFAVADPKPRRIHKASVWDRLLHHAVYRLLYPFFDKTFIADSFSCRAGKGTHRALDRFRSFARKAGRNHTRTCWVLKCDIRKFFASIDHQVLLDILRSYIPDSGVMRLLGEVIGSFHASKPGVGLPLGNLTSQLFANVYMNELDRFVKHRLRARYYIRYADDFAILSHDRGLLEAHIAPIREFLARTLKLSLHEDKIVVKTIASGIDFLGWAHFPDHRVLRRATRRKMMRRLAENNAPETVQSYLGLLRHGNTEKLKARIFNFLAGDAG